MAAKAEDGVTESGRELFFRFGVDGGDRLIPYISKLGRALPKRPCES